ncbi:MAG: N-acetyltransferase [Sphingobacteriales bacterium]|nr:N-acetyltransferase [Sphingobacteriales bacterium]
MDRLNTLQANIENLVSLWQAAATPFEGCFRSNDFNYCYVENSDWPNRLWFGQEITEESIEAAKHQIHTTSKNLIIPCWGFNNNTSFKFLEGAGFRERSVQIGMSLQLGERPQKQLRLQLERVVDSDQAKAWAVVYPRAFGYRICEDILTNTQNDIEFYLASYQGQPVGTAIIYKTDDVVGIHGVGVIPEMRRQGIAEEIMEFALNRAVVLQASYVILQASVMGKGLYDKLGFKEQFTIKNYLLD